MGPTISVLKRPADDSDPSSTFETTVPHACLCLPAEAEAQGMMGCVLGSDLQRAAAGLLKTNVLKTFTA